eukprot:NODE_3_length_80033_cov_0.932970.p66 type:complete len:125 gc:universal NODE_3_length_80033_cov_0.932970:5798-6172(+)
MSLLFSFDSFLVLGLVSENISKEANKFCTGANFFVELISCGAISILPKSKSSSALDAEVRLLDCVCVTEPTCIKLGSGIGPSLQYLLNSYLPRIKLSELSLKVQLPFPSQYQFAFKFPQFFKNR